MFKEKDDFMGIDPEVKSRAFAHDYLGTTAVEIISEDEIEEYDQQLFGFEDETPIHRALADIATAIINVSEGADLDDDVLVPNTYDPEIGAIGPMPCTNSDLQDMTAMVADLLSARSSRDLERILMLYRDLPGATALAQAISDSRGYELKIA